MRTLDEMTLDDAKQLRNGQTIYHVSKVDSRGNPVRYKVTSVKTWKRDPERIEIGLKYGLYAYEKIQREHLGFVVLKHAQTEHYKARRA